MSADESPLAAAPVPTDAPAGGSQRAANAKVKVGRGVFYLMLVTTALALGASVLLWQRLSTIQEQLARQSGDSAATAVEARTLARQAHELARDVAARQALADGRLAEVTQQRAQLESLMQSLSSTRDETLAVDIDAALRLAQQQAQLTLSAEPLLAALRTADQRLARANQPRLVRVRAALARDIERIKAAPLVDVPGLLVRIDELARAIDELPMVNAVGPAAAAPARRGASVPAAQAAQWWQRAVIVVREEAQALVRISRIDQPDAVLAAPEQAFFLRENLKLKLLNARLSLLARQTDLARADLATAAVALAKYFDSSARRTQAAAVALQQLQAQVRLVELPRVDETLAQLGAVGGGR